MTDERERLERVMRGDEQAYAEVFRAWYAPLVRFSDALLRRRDEAEEVAQEVLLELWQRRAQLDSSLPVQGWLFRAARNRALNVLRHRKVVSGAEPHVLALTSSPMPADATTAERELQAALHEALALLPPRCREVFHLSRAERLRNAEIAARLGISVKGVEAQIARALRSLRETLSPWLPPGRSL